MTIVTGFPCSYCKEEICQCDGAPETQEEVTSGTSFKEHWERILKETEETR